METTSRKGLIQAPPEKVFNFLSDFNHFTPYIPSDMLRNWQCTADSCRFTVDMVGELEIAITEKVFGKSIMAATVARQPFDISLLITLVEVGEEACEAQIILNANIPLMLQFTVKKPLQEAMDKLMSTIEGMQFS